MTREDIIDMSHYAGGSINDPSDLLSLGSLERFADLVAAAERDAILKILRDGWFMTQKEVEAAIQARGNNGQS